jgi:AcrR family transcriptional regulator
MGDMRLNKEQARQAIIETALEMARSQGIASLTMAHVAAACGLTRQGVYWHFKTRTSMLEAMLDHFYATLPNSELMFTGMPDATAEESLEVMMRAWLAQLPQVSPVLLALHDAALTDPEAQEVLAARHKAIATVIENVYLRRFVTEGLVGPDFDTRGAAEMMVVLGSPTVYQQMTGIFGWSHERSVDDIVGKVRQMIREARQELGETSKMT